MSTRWPPRAIRILVVALLAIAVSGILVHYDLVIAARGDLDIVPYLVAGYIALDFLIPFVTARSANDDTSHEP